MHQIEVTEADAFLLKDGAAAADSWLKSGNYNLLHLLASDAHEQFLDQEFAMACMAINMMNLELPENAKETWMQGYIIRWAQIESNLRV